MMRTVTRSLGKVTRPKRVLGHYNFPQEAIQLSQDISTLEIIQGLLCRLEDRSFVERGSADYRERVEEAQKVLRRLGFLVAHLKEIATTNLTLDYRDGEKINPGRRRQTISEVLQLLFEGFKIKK